MTSSVSRVDIYAEDLQGLAKAQQSYGDSWKRRGGVGAFMMLARKWDRLVIQVSKCNGDIQRAIDEDERAEGVIDDIRDLRRYLILVENEMMGVFISTNNASPSWVAFSAMAYFWDDLEARVKEQGWDIFKEYHSCRNLVRWLIEALADVEAIARKRGFNSASKKHRDNGG